MGKIILASSSPRRADILKEMKIDFEVIPSTYVEKRDKTDFSYNFVENQAYHKALSVARLLRKERRYIRILGADTIVVLDNKILGKPQNRNEAYMMLKKLSGRTHYVVTGLALIDSETFASEKRSDTTFVTFENLTDEQINNYIDKFQPYDKAGAYGIQELPEGFIRRVSGARDNVIGLPTRTVMEMLNSDMED